MKRGRETPENFRGLLYTPSYENEVVLLFGMLMPYLDSQFVIDEYSGSFPDCRARRDGNEIGIEFEVNSKDFVTHKHPDDPNLSKCDLIICWENYWKKNKVEFHGHEIEVYELSEIMKQKGLGFTLVDKPKYQKRILWTKESFFRELGKKVNTNEFDQISEIYGFCLSHPEFEVVFGEGRKIAGFNVRVKKWQSEKMGVRSPVQVYADGKLTIDYQRLPENLETEFRKITEEPKDKWHSFNLRDQKTLNRIKEALEWLTHV